MSRRLAGWAHGSPRATRRAPALALAASALLLSMPVALPGLAAVPALASARSSLAASAPSPARTSLTQIEAEVMCPVCGTLLELAESPQAQRERAFVARLIAAGRTRAQVREALVAQYGPQVLALPRASGFDLSAYLVPALALLLAAVALALGLRRWRRGGGGPGPESPSEDAAARLDADLARYDL